ncbi:MAG: hypothetical protein FJY56_09525 [Betaproteobacteria bacterium]|nr:hypothetical protein [Betaproteobacteria bacterium]
MCWALYLASDKELPTVPWDEDHPSFNTQALSDVEEPVRTQFSLPYVIYIGSHEGCGCGFKNVDYDDPDECRKRAETVHSLAEYLCSALSQGAHLEMFLCWEGDQTHAPVAKKSITPTEFLALEFPLAEKEFADIVT